MRTKSHIIILGAIILGVMLLLPFAAMRTQAAEIKRVVKVLDLQGVVKIKPFKEEWKTAAKDMLLEEGDIIKTGKGSRALLSVNGEGETATLEVKENSQLLFSELVADDEKKTQTTLLDLALGEVKIKAKKIHAEESKFEVKTPTSVVGVRGTEFDVEVKALE